MKRSVMRKLALLGTLAVTGLVGCGLWVWTGVYTYSFGPLGVSTTLSQPNPIAVNLDMDLYVDQLGHATCQFHVSGCAATVNIGNDSWSAPKCLLVNQTTCIGSVPGDTFGAAIDGKMLTQTNGTVDTYTLTISDFGFGPLSVPVAR